MIFKFDEPIWNVVMMSAPLRRTYYIRQAKQLKALGKEMYKFHRLLRKTKRLHEDCWILSDSFILCVKPRRNVKKALVDIQAAFINSFKKKNIRTQPSV